MVPRHQASASRCAAGRSPDQLGQPINAGGRVAPGIVVPRGVIQTTGPDHGLGIAVLELRELDVLVVLRQMFLQQPEQFLPRLGTGIVAEVENQPQLDAGIGNREFNSVIACRLFGLGKIRMLVNVEDAPDGIEFQVLVPLLPGRPVRGPFCDPALA